MMYVGLDPGGTTGIAACQLHEGKVDAFNATQVEPNIALDWLWEVLITMPYQYVTVYAERFVITPATVKMSRQLDALYVIGAVRWMCHRVESRFELRDPATCKHMAKNNVLRTMNMWTPGEGHANDAARVLVVALVEAGCGSLILDG